MTPGPIDRRTFGRRAVAVVLTGGALRAAGDAQDDGTGDGIGLAVDLDDPRYAALRTVGAALKVVPPGTFAPVIVVHVSPGEFVAFSSTCPHRSCEVDLPDARGVVVCPCHDSTFDLRGRFLAGPAQRDLPPVTLSVSSATAVAPASWGRLKDRRSAPGVRRDAPG